MTRFVDRRIAKAIAIKRIVTGTLGLACGLGTIVAVLAHGGAPLFLFAAALVLFFGGGAWALRDGLRLLRDLRVSA